MRIEARAEAVNHLEKAVLADLEKAALRGEQPRGTDADAALGPLLDRSMNSINYLAVVANQCVDDPFG